MISVPNKFYVYIHRRLDTNKIFYIGKGSGSRFNKKQGRNKYWMRIVNKHGFKSEIIFNNLEEDVAFSLEKDLIYNFNLFGVSLVNATEGGEGSSGMRHSNSVKKKLSDLRKGKQLSEEIRIKLSKCKTGTILSDHTREKISNSHMGKSLSDIHKNKISCSKTGISVLAKIDKNIYTFFKEDDSFTGTRIMFAKYAKLTSEQVARLFGSKPRRSILGWELYKQK